MDDVLHLWGEDVRVTGRERLGDFELLLVRASDDSHALVFADEVRMEADCGDLRAFLSGRIAGKGMEPVFERSEGDAFLAEIRPLHGLLEDRFPGQAMGVIVLVNGREPGTRSLPDIRPRAGDLVQTLYKVSR